MEDNCNGQEPCLIFRLNDDGAGPDVLKETFYEKGWIEYDEDVHDELQWNLWWKTSRFRTSDYNQLYPWQRVNHCPKATGITRKDCLARLLKLQQALHGSAYSFAPQSYILPNEYRKFTQEFTSQAEKNLKTGTYWICKPADMSRGRGISIIRELSQLQYDTNSIVQQYITNPMLIHGHKFDIRLYAVVISYHPLVIYLYNDGIVRFSCEKYDLSSLGNVYAHLTNTSINKHSSSYHTDKVGIGQGSKWTVKQFRHYLHQCHIDDSDLWWKIVSIIDLTIIPQISEVPKANNCFELYGFDILIDRDMKPWLLEVNFSPSLNSECTADAVKKEMLSDLVDLMEFRPEDSHQSNDTLQSRGEYRTTRRDVGCRRSSVRSSSRRPQSMMITRLPQINVTNPRYCMSANDNTDTYGSEDGEEEEWRPPRSKQEGWRPPRSNILTCSLSQINSLPSSLVNSSSPSGDRLRAPDARLAGAVQNDSKPSLLRPLTQSNSRLKCYNKPWRQDSGTVKIQKLGLTDKTRKLGEKAVVGGFHRVYPFNAMTGKSISPRQMVLETHQMIRSKLSDASTAASTKFPSKPVTSRRPANRTPVKSSIVSPFPRLC